MDSLIDGSAARILITTLGSIEDGERVAAALVSEKLAACVNIIPGVRSVYRWEGAVQSDTEVILVIKTIERRLAETAQRVCQLHPYTTPEIVTVAVDSVSSSYLAWLIESITA